MISTLLHVKGCVDITLRWVYFNVHFVLSVYIVHVHSVHLSMVVHSILHLRWLGQPRSTLDVLTALVRHLLVCPPSTVERSWFAIMEKGK
jgi:hypothetical protein